MEMGSKMTQTVMGWTQAGGTVGQKRESLTYKQSRWPLGKHLAQLSTTTVHSCCLAQEAAMELSLSTLNPWEENTPSFARWKKLYHLP